MKRAKALRPLSREHLGALLVAKKLCEADEVESARRTFLEFWAGEGRLHFRIEEEVLLPGWAAHGKLDRAGVSRMLGEHLAIRREALRLAAGELAIDRVHELGALLHDHVRFEERELFAAAEAALDEAALEWLAALIEAAEAEAC